MTDLSLLGSSLAEICREMVCHFTQVILFLLVFAGVVLLLYLKFYVPKVFYWVPVRGHTVCTWTLKFSRSTYVMLENTSYAKLLKTVSHLFIQYLIL